MSSGLVWLSTGGWLSRVPTGQEAGQEGPRSIRIELRISHGELASMVGTTRPRVSLFMERFKHLGLIETSLEHHLIIKESKLTTYQKSILWLTVGRLLRPTGGRVLKVLLTSVGCHIQKAVGVGE
jgi:hypothetical protein